MKKIAFGTLLIVCVAANAQSQQQPPELLLRTAQCLAVKKFLPPSKSARLTFGYFFDEKSYPGDTVIYIVEYATPTRSNGHVFTVFLADAKGRQEFSIQNNASFVLSKNEPSGVSFLDPPLGGTWTQAHLAAAIQQIEKQRRFRIPVKLLSSPDRSFTCDSYTDSQRKSS